MSFRYKQEIVEACVLIRLLFLFVLLLCTLFFFVCFHRVKKLI